MGGGPNQSARGLRGLAPCLEIRFDVLRRVTLATLAFLDQSVSSSLPPMAWLARGKPVYDVVDRLFAKRGSGMESLRLRMHADPQLIRSGCTCLVQMLNKIIL